METKQLRDNMVELTPAPGKWLHKKGTDIYLPVAPVRAGEAGEWEEVDSRPAYTEEEYKAETVRLIRQRYDSDDESAILRKAAALLLAPVAPMSDGPQEVEEPDKTQGVIGEFLEYNAYAEECKARARETLAARSAD